jgi:hypothetical protein
MKRLFFENEKKADDAVSDHEKAIKRGEEFLARMTKVERQRPQWSCRSIVVGGKGAHLTFWTGHFDL